MTTENCIPYDGYAEDFEEAASDNAYNALYDRPAVLGLLGDVKGLSVLDAGCGPGLYARELVARGAEVTGFDQSGDMVALARRRLGPRATLVQHDLARPLDWIASGTYDAAIMTLVVHYVPDRVACLRELRRVLRPEGRLIVSTSHPTADWAMDGGSYFAEKFVEDQWSCGMLSRFWRQPLESWFTEFWEAGFLVERLREMRPAEGMAESHPEEYEKLSREPGFIAFRLAVRDDG
ncbi:class I SAM-dependent methyltransferase [Streptomyces genisteinicus]|uniref:Class I SAM-dependent methyltransferase n=1 Tax=Streptomyces genisteinicus TaxID=2768068 RepID=A0A7H0HZ72_9ACTN|nr:class I SAM-dependent methyltransferase [Streptomyces genisteinicus]QNP65838.1 class I SAM-dependent methyltransferase [Streptomyces genisteinicus]